MSKFYARVVSGSVVEVWEAPPKVTPDKAFHPDLPGDWIACAPDVEPGFVHDDGRFRPMTPDERPAPLAIGFPAFLALFPREERVALVAEAISDPETKMWYDRLLSLQAIPLDDEEFREGLQSLAARKIITEDRASRVLLGRGHS